MTTLLQDFRFALRQLRRTPGFVAVALLTLALGIGATTAIFTLVYQVMLRSLPVDHPEQLYKLGAADDCCVTSGVQAPSWNLFSYDLYRTLRDNTPGTEGLAAVSAREYHMSARRADRAAAPEVLRTEFVSGNYFTVLGLHAYTGRLLTPADDVLGAAPVAVLSYSLWQSRFAADPSALGATLLVSGHPVTVVGIMAKNFLSDRNETNYPGLLLPLALQPTFQPDENLLEQAGMAWLDLLTRVKDTHSVPAVQAAVQTGLHRWIDAHRDTTQGASPDQIRKATTQLTPASSGINNLRSQYQDHLRLLLLIAGFVLLIACANLANLLLVRGMARQGELALRTALGAPRSRLIRQSLVEAFILALLGGLLGLLVAYGGAHAILVLAFKSTAASPLSAAPSLPVLAFAMLLSVGTGVLFGTAPALISSRVASSKGPAQSLRGTGRSAIDRTALPQRVLVTLQAALSLALLCTAGLLIQSLRQLEHQDFHFEPQGRLVVSTDLAAAGYTAAKLPAVYQQIDNTFGTLPSVTRFAYATYGPMTGSNWSTGIWFSGGAEKAVLAGYLDVSTDFFPTIGTPVLAGRGFSQQDTASSEHVAVINQTFANRYLAGKQPIGLHFGPDPTLRNEFEIVGVVADAKYGDPAKPADPMFFKAIRQTILMPDAQSRSVEAAIHFPDNLFIQYRGDSTLAANQVRAALRSINPDIPVLSLLTYQDQVGSSFTDQDLVVRLTTLFGGVALLLAAVGLYGVTAYSVARRTRDIGLRMAMGASRRSVLTLVLRGALGQVAIGLAVGVPLSLLAGHMLAHTLYQTSALQPLMLGAVIALLLLAATVAAFVPARRAASIDPVLALRTE